MKRFIALFLSLTFLLCPLRNVSFAEKPHIEINTNAENNLESKSEEKKDKIHKAKRKKRKVKRQVSNKNLIAAVFTLGSIVSVGYYYYITHKNNESFNNNESGNNSFFKIKIRGKEYFAGYQ